MDLEFVNSGAWYTRPLREFNERITNLMLIFVAASRGATEYFNDFEESGEGLAQKVGAEVHIMREIGSSAESELFRWGLVACWASFEGGMKAHLADWLRFLSTLKLEVPLEVDDPEAFIDDLLRDARKKRGRSGVDHFSSVAQQLAHPDDYWEALKHRADPDLVRLIRDELHLFFALRNLAAHAGPMIAEDRFVRGLPRSVRYLVGDEIRIDTDLFVRLTGATRFFAGAVDEYTTFLGAQLEEEFGA